MSSHHTTHSEHAIEDGYGIRRLTQLAWPIMVNMLSMTAMLVTDTIFVAQLGTEALAAIGLAITFGVMRVINMAHGEFIMMGAYTGYVVQQIIPNNTVSIIVAIPRCDFSERPATTKSLMFLM